VCTLTVKTKQTRLFLVHQAPRKKYQMEYRDFQGTLKGASVARRVERFLRLACHLNLPLFPLFSFEFKREHPWDDPHSSNLDLLRGNGFDKCYIPNIWHADNSSPQFTTLRNHPHSCLLSPQRSSLPSYRYLQRPRESTPLLPLSIPCTCRSAIPVQYDTLLADK
jgi:hypothetical protein